QISVPAFDMDFRGTYTHAISDVQQVTIPKIYKAFLTRRTRLELASGQERTTYFLEKLED
ncbi:MAG: hypothetical protein ABI165_19120, partial [Bryobacteraceae bacterium]